jgi:hypothetical protein
MFIGICWVDGKLFFKKREILTEEEHVILDNEVSNSNIILEPNNFLIDSKHLSNCSLILPYNKKCPICLEFFFVIKVCIFNCGHSVCYDCLKKLIQYSQTCPICRSKL